MYSSSYSMPSNSNIMYKSGSSYQTPSYTTYATNSNDDRFFGPFVAPFLFGGLAGTALGYGIANNNQINRPCCPNAVYYPFPMYQQSASMYQQSSPMNTNNFYY